jgi:type IV pilus assembly protein PilY1
LLVTLKDASGAPQPITAKPTVATVGDFPVVIVGTGRYLGVSDLTDDQIQSVYAIKDKLDATTLASPRTSGSNFVQQTLDDGTCPSDAPSTICNQGQVVRTVSQNAVDWTVKNGWFFDFLTGGERAATDSTLALGTLAFTTVSPQVSTDTAITCTGSEQSAAGKSFLYYVDYRTGGAVAGTKGVVGEEICACVSTRPSVVKAQDGSVQGLIRMSGGAGLGTDMGTTRKDTLPTNLTPGEARRISWRELSGE